MLARQLLRTGSGASTRQLSVVPPPSGDLTAFELIATANGGAWHNWSNPRAVYDSVSDKTFFTYISSAGQVIVGEYNHATLVTTRTAVATTETDMHNTPAIILRDDRRLLSMYTKHNVSYFRARISTNVADSTAWGTEINLDALGNTNNKTYPNLIKLSGDAAGTIHCIFRNWNGTNWSWRETISTNSGATWGSAVQVYASFTLQAYCFFTDNGVDTIHIVATDRQPTLGATTKMAHAYRLAGSYYGTDGTLLAPVSGVLQYGDMTEFWTAPGGQAAWESDFCLDGTGKPVVVHYDGISATDWRYNYSKWDGAAWSSVEIASSYDSFPNSGNAGGLAINRANVLDLYVAAMQPSGRYEMEQWTSVDAGATFPATSITTGSSVDQVMPCAVRDSAAECRVIWISGGYNVQFTDYDFAFKGATE